MNKKAVNMDFEDDLEEEELTAPEKKSSSYKWAKTSAKQIEAAAHNTSDHHDVSKT
jgi:hypothetical protein